ncbi:MAG: DEAD/DEAH box helicase [Bacillus sp. (in: firmicutes)]
MPDFLSMGISENIVNKLTESGIAVPTPIQEQAIPLVMEGKDVIAQAQTGTGKTFAFVLPILEKINLSASHIQALIVTPTRELALQITNEIEKLIGDDENINVLAAYGGQDVEKQLNKLKRNIQIVVGTPGRLLDHIRRETINLSSLSTLVLDEADQMLHIGFLEEVEQIIKATPKTRQTMLFSATMPAEIRKLANKHMTTPEYIQVEKTQGPALSVKQIAIHTVDRAKQATLIDLIETHRPFLAVIFCRTKRRVSKLYDALKAHGFPCDELHGDLSQAKREQVMKKFREAEIQLLIATDVAARGLDVEGVTNVYNYDIPQDAESYIHRIGRTGRAGMSGLAVTLYSAKDRPALDLIEKELNITIKKQNIGNMNKADNEVKDFQGVTASKPPRAKRNRNSKPFKKDTKPKAVNAKGDKHDERPFTRNNKQVEQTGKGKKSAERSFKGGSKSSKNPERETSNRSTTNRSTSVKPGMKKKGFNTQAGKRRNSR